MINAYKKLEYQIAEAPRKPMEILQAIQPMAEATWYKTAIMARIQDLPSSDFIQAMTILDEKIISNYSL